MDCQRSGIMVTVERERHEKTTIFYVTMTNNHVQSRGVIINDH